MGGEIETTPNEHRLRQPYFWLGQVAKQFQWSISEVKDAFTKKGYARTHTMQFRAAAIDQIAQFICGDSPLPFPYRSSSKLTSFFTGLDLDYIHRGETRNPWVRDALADINRKSPKETPFPSEHLVSVIEELMNPVYFEGQDAETVDYDAALSRLALVLKPYRLEVVYDERTASAHLRSADGIFVSTAHPAPEVARKITFLPRVFEVPNETAVQADLVAVMMPFAAGFNSVYEAIHKSCSDSALRCKRADDIWANSTIIQDIFALIFVAAIVVVDFTGKNSNVMYETGVAHTLGKHVVPITQSIDDVPFDLHSHRVLKYLPNQEGLTKLSQDLSARLVTIVHGHSWDT